jgi:hypothetical protein
MIKVLIMFVLMIFLTQCDSEEINQTEKRINQMQCPVIVFAKTHWKRYYQSVILLDGNGYKHVFEETVNDHFVNAIIDSRKVGDTLIRCREVKK